jgi:hypothetical protein
MKKIIYIIFLCFIVIGISACAPKQTNPPLPDSKPPVTNTTPPATTEPAIDLATACVSENGKWSAEYKECEGISKATCETIGGKFNECASACRHDPKAEICTMQCVLVCEFSKSDSSQPTTPEATNPPIVGGDKDEHGCIGSAGYQWCENKQKCLRIWEEDCNPELSGTIQQLFADKYKKPLSEIKVTIAQATDTHVRGSVLFGEPGQGGGGNFLATKTDGAWKLVFDGNGGIACKDLEPYGFPKTMTQDLCAE